MANESDDRRFDRPRRILFVITDLDAGGAEKCCTQLAVGLDRTRWCPAVCCLTAAGVMAERLREHGIPVYALEARHVGDLRQTALRLARLMVQLQPVLVHSFLFHANILARVIARLAGATRVLSSVRVAEKRYRYHLILENLTCRMSRRVVCVSDAVARFTRRHAHVPSSRLTVIPNGIAEVPSAFRPSDRRELGVPSDAVFALYVGRLDPQKGVDVLLRAMASAPRELSRLHVWLAGAGPDREMLTRMARELGLESRVHFLGWREDVQSLMQAADFLVLPSRWEGMPNVILEAMAAGLPVVATRAEGSVELVRDGETGLLVEIDRPDELARAMIAMAGDAALRSQWGRNGRALACRDFSLTAMIERYERLYSSVLAERI